MFVLLRVGPNLAQNVHSQKSIFYFLKLIHSFLHPLNFRVHSRNILLVAILAVNMVRLDKIYYAKWARRIGGMGEQTIWDAFFEKHTFSFKSCRLFRSTFAKIPSQRSHSSSP